MRVRIRSLGVEHGNGAGFQGCINGKNAHTSSLTLFCGVIAGHSRPKDGVLPHAYVPAIPLSRAMCHMNRDGRDKPGHDDEIEVPRGAAGYIGRTSTTSGTKWRSRF